MDVAQSTPLGLLHDHTHRFLIAFKIPFHGPEDFCFGLDTVQLDGQITQLLAQLIPALGAGLLAQGVAGDRVIGSGHILAGTAQFPAAVVHIGLRCAAALFAGTQIIFQLGGTLCIFLQAGLQAADISLTAGQIRSQFTFFGTQLQKLSGDTLGGAGHSSHLLLQCAQFIPLGLQIGCDLGNAAAGLLQLSSDAAAAVIGAFEFFFDTGNVGVVIADIAAEHRDLAFQLLMDTLQHADLHANIFQFLIPAAQLAAQLFGTLIKLIQILVGLLQDKGCRSIVLLCLFCIGGQLFQAIQPHSYLNTLQFILQLQVLMCLFGLHAQRLQLQFQLRHLVTNTHQVILSVAQLPLGLLLAVTVLGDTGSLLKDLTAVCTLQRKDLVDTALADIGIALSAQAGIHEHLVDIAQAGRLTVDIVFAVAAAIIAAGDHDLIGIVSQGTVGIIQSQRCFCKADRSTLLRTAKDHVLHLGTAEGFGTLLAHDPKDRVRNIRFTGAVGTHDGGDIVAKADQRLIRKGLKALYFQRF